MTRRKLIWLAGVGVAGMALLGGAYALWRRPARVYGAIAGVARDVSRGPHQIGASLPSCWRVVQTFQM